MEEAGVNSTDNNMKQNSFSIEGFISEQSRIFPEAGVICITGYMAAGKNFVCSKIEEKLPVYVSIDLDKTVHTAIELTAEKIFKTFEKDAEQAGICLKNPDGTLNRRALGALIFPKPELLKKQESIVYPKTVELTKEFISETEAEGRIPLINATVLYKTPELMNLCDGIIFVTAPLFTRLFRARKRDSLPFRHILRRFYAQRMLLKEYRKTGRKIIIIKNN